MCQRCTMASVTTFIQPKIPVATTRFRRRYKHRPPAKAVNSPENSFKVDGVACLCFPEDHSWFRGTISSGEEDDYSIQGQFVIMTSQEKSQAATSLADKVRKLSFTDEENNNVECEVNVSPKNSEQLDTSSRYYQVFVIDHHTGLNHKLPRIFPKDSSESIFESQNGEVSFKAEKVFKGQRAELEIKKLLGSTKGFHGNNFVYTGTIKFKF